MQLDANNKINIDRNKRGEKDRHTYFDKLFWRYAH